MSEGPLIAYQKMIRRGQIKPDPAQERAVATLQTLWLELAKYPLGKHGRVWLKIFRFSGADKQPRPIGLYIFGPVGRGKSMLMDLLYDSVTSRYKRRVHFHAFMLEIHNTMHKSRQKGGSSRDPLAHIAADIAKRTYLLCFDEFQVDNIADAMILGRLFSALFYEGVVVVATSNSRPDNLYPDGLQRDRFLPFIDIIKENTNLLELDGDHDHRRSRLLDMGVYYSPLGDTADAAVEAAFIALTDGIKPVSERIPVMGREVVVPLATKGVAKFSFGDLCEKPLGAPDYIAIARAYHTVILTDVPAMSAAKRNEAKRTVTLIDTLYEHNVNIIVSAATEPDKLCIEGDTAVAFRRTASRLIEMQSAEYINSTHIK